MKRMYLAECKHVHALFIFGFDDVRLGLSNCDEEVTLIALSEGSGHGE